MTKQRLNSPTIQETGLNEVLYTAIMEMSLDQKKGIPDKFKKHLNTAKRAQNFIQKSSTDQKREVLQYLEYCSFMVISPAGSTGIRRFEKVFKEYKSGNVLEGLKQAARTGVLVIADREFSYLLGKMSQSMISGTYAKNHELIRVGNVINKWPKKIKHEDEDYDYLSNAMAKTILWSGICLEQSESSIGLSSDIIKMLSFLYIKKDTYVNREEISNYFVGLIVEKRIISNIKYLSDNFYIQKHFDWRKKEYTITKLGIRTVHQFRDRVLKSFNF